MGAIKNSVQEGSLDTNNSLLCDLNVHGPKSGPWGPITFCTDYSIGLGAHTREAVHFSLGSHLFAQKQKQLGAPALRRRQFSAASWCLLTLGGRGGPAASSLGAALAALPCDVPQGQRHRCAELPAAACGSLGPAVLPCRPSPPAPAPPAAPPPPPPLLFSGSSSTCGCPRN